MKTTLKHGAVIETVSPTEMRTMLNERTRANNAKRVRATMTLKLDANGDGTDEVYVVPVGFQFEARRVSLDLDSATDPSTGNVPLNVAGKFVEYRRSGTLIEYAVPSSPNAVPQVPGIQTWGSEQGPYLRNGETFEVLARGLTANATLTVVLEGILSKPEDPR